MTLSGKKRRRERRRIHGFSNNPFMIGYDINLFEGDMNLGFRFPKGMVISSTKFRTLEQIIAEISLGDTVVLNIGDSSTSGWNGNRIFKGNYDRTAPFFTYKTYPQLMEEQSNLIVINAGVPGYSSFQGRKYLDDLLKKFAREGVAVDYVTIYFGNNDAAYNRHEDKVLLDRKKPSPLCDGSRVTVEDYKKNLRSMIETAGEYGVKPILIMPVVHYDWEPGIRSLYYPEEFERSLRLLEDTEAKNDLLKAREEFKRGNYREATELDRFLPRIKMIYQETLKQVAEEMRVPLIDIQEHIPFTDNDEYFADYCHPLEPVNQMIVDAFLKTAGIKKWKRSKVKSIIPLKYRIMEWITGILGYLTSGGNNDDAHQPFEKIYPLH